MPLVIENGTLVANADSYIELDEARAYAQSRGATLPSDDAELEALLRNAADYIDQLETQFKGRRVSVDQALAWPRDCVYIYGASTPVDKESIPSLVKKAQAQLAVDGASLPGGLMPIGSGREVKKEKLDVLETEYFEGGSNSILPVLNKAMAILGPLLGSNGLSLRSVRV